MVADEKISTILSDIHGDQDSKLIKDLISYMIINETSTMQHFPGYEWEHLTTSQKNYDDTQVSGFLKKDTGKGDRQVRKSSKLRLQIR